MKLPYSNKDRVLKSPYHTAINLWNQLDEETQSIETGEEFKRKLKLIKLILCSLEVDNSSIDMM